MGRPRKEERFKIHRFKNPSGRYAYRVEGYQPDGRRVRKNFKRKVDALEERLKLESEIEEGTVDYSLQRTSLNAEQLRDAENAIGLLSKGNLSDTVSHYSRLRKLVREKADYTLDQAVEFFRQHYRPEIQQLSIRAAVDSFIESRQNVEASTRRSYQNGLKLLVAKDPNKSVHHFTVHDIQTVLNKYKSPGTQLAYRRSFSVFFNWAVRYHYALENPCQRLDRPLPLTGKIGVLSLNECQRLLKAAFLLHGGVMASSIAIPLFAGLRPSELADLQPQDIREGDILVEGGKMRRKIKRRVPIPPVLRSWLDMFPYEGRPKGWEYKMRKLKKLTEAQNWVDDVLRHSSISYQMARDQNAGATAHNCGTSAQMIERHYLEIIEEAKEVEEYWMLSPSVIEELDIELELNSREHFDWPVDSKLKAMVWKKPLSRLSSDLGVSDSAIRKRCKARGIELPKNGHWQKVNANSR